MILAAEESAGIVNPQLNERCKSAPDSSNLGGRERNFLCFKSATAAPAIRLFPLAYERPFLSVRDC